MSKSRCGTKDVTLTLPSLSHGMDLLQKKSLFALFTVGIQPVSHSVTAATDSAKLSMMCARIMYQMS